MCGRYAPAVRVRNNLVAALQNLSMAGQYTGTVALPYCDTGEMETLRTAVSYIFHDMQTQVKRRI